MIFFFSFAIVCALLKDLEVFLLSKVSEFPYILMFKYLMFSSNNFSLFSKASLLFLNKVLMYSLFVLNSELILYAIFFDWFSMFSHWETWFSRKSSLLIIVWTNNNIASVYILNIILAYLWSASGCTFSSENCQSL